MADPLSLLATAAGLVSLGLQLYGNFAEYLDGVKCSQNEIASATQRLMGMHDALRIVEATLPRLQAVEQTSQVTVMQCIRSCDSQMASLKTLLDDFGVHPSPNGFRAHLDEQKKKLRYPYRRDHIRRLEERIDSVTGTLSIAIQGLGLDFAAKQSQIADSQFTLITKHLDELNSSIAKQEAIMMELQSNIDTTVHRLVTKPAYFRDVCDNLLSTKAPTKRSYDTSMGGFGICTCTLRRRARRLGLSLPLWFGAYLESSKSSTHRSDCPMAVLNDVKVRQEVGVWTTLASRSISISLTFSINSSFGAGGISISPSLRTCRVVDEMTSPIFQLLYWTGRNSDILFASASEARQYLQTSITRLFHERQFLPTDLSYNGTSILDVLSPFFLFRDVAKLDGYLDVAGMLSRFGTGNGSDRFRSRYWYFMAKISMPEWDSAPLEEFSLSIERLYAYGVGMALTSIHNPYPMTSLSGNKNLMMSLPKIPDLAYDVGVGPRSLNLAILRGSSEEVTEICHEKPSSINETILSNISPYHLSATFYPPALQILRDSGLLNSAHPNLSYSGGNTVLEEALACSGEVCNSQPGQHPCQQCCCFESVALLLDLDCAIIWRAQLAEASCSASYRARSILLDHLRNRRERLKEWAIRHLPSSEARKLGLHKTVMLDYPDLELLFDALNQHKLNVPSYLVPFRDQYDSLSTPASVFSFVVLASTAETLYEMGFHNVDTTDFFRHPYIHNLFTIKWPLSLHLEVEYLGWLLGKDTAVPPWSTDIHQRYPISRTDMLGHLVASRLGTYFRFRAQGELMSDLESPSSTIPTILKSLVRMEDRDECKCFCSYSGCSALTTCLNEWNKWSSFGPAIGNSDWYFIPILEKYLDESSDPDDIERFAMQHIRFLTFSALGCSHTCCRDEQDMCEITPEDREAVWEEDKENLDLLEQLVGEFSTDYHSRGLATSTFLKEIWELRMEHVLAERDRDLVARRLSEEDVKAARKLGVTLTMDEDNESEPESVTMWFSDEHETADEKEERKIQREQRIAHMKKRIDQICKWDV